MATESTLQSVTYQAGSDLSANQYHFVTMADDNQVDATGDGGLAVGVQQNDPAAAGRACVVAITGRSKVVYGDTIDEDDIVSSDSTGRAVPSASGDYILGQAGKAGVVGDIGDIQLMLSGAKKA